MDGSPSGLGALEARWERRIQRERRARRAAEDLLEAKSLELYEANRELASFAAALEQRVLARTRDLDRAREHAVVLAERDQLTGLPNRMRYGRVLDEAMAEASRTSGRVALLAVDIDDFKRINDTFGHGAGDAFLRSVATRLGLLLRGRDSVARVGGDEFVVVVTDWQAIEDILAIAVRIIAMVGLQVDHDGERLQASCSIGIAVYPDDAASVTDLTRYADVALYTSKSLGRARYTLFDADLKAEFERRYALAAELPSAIESGQIVPFFQPIVESATGRVVGVEVLARWLHPTRGTLMPGLFIGLAEEQGLIVSLFAHQLRAACLIGRVWVEAGAIDYLSVNVSPSQFRVGALVDVIERILRETDFDPRALTVEITEDLLLHDLERARMQLEGLAAFGVRVSLDDFGAGYSNIAYLRRLPINTLKLDRLVTMDVCRDDKARSVLKAIVDMARSLGLRIVAEGVESETQARWLRRLGCDFLQGFFFGKPMSQRAFLDAHGRAAADGPRGQTDRG